MLTDLHGLRYSSLANERMFRMMEPDVLAQGDYYIEVSVKITFFLFNIITCHKHLVVILYQNTSPLKMVVGPQSNNHMLKRFTVQFQSHDHKQCC